MQFLRLLYDVTRAKEACVNMNLVPLPEILSDADEGRRKKDASEMLVRTGSV